MNALSAVVGVWALLAAGFSWLTWLRLGRVRPGDASGADPGVLLLRPVDRPTDAELENLSAPIHYPGVLEHWVISPSRPAMPAATGWLESEPRCANRKVGHLIQALSVLKREGLIVVVVDADVRVTGALLRALVAPVCAGAALCHAAPEPLPSRDLAGRATRALLLNTHHNFRALDAVRAGAPSVCGKALGFAAPALSELTRLHSHVGEDLELATRLHRAGHRIVLADLPAQMPQTVGLALQTVISRFSRWMAVLRAHRPALYPAVPLLFASSLPLLVLAVASGSAIARGAVGFAWAARVALSHRLAQMGTGRFSSAKNSLSSFQWILGEALMLAAFAASLVSRTVRWRGRRLVLGKGGLIEGELK
jgi:ceramide glucosyltransferase